MTSYPFYVITIFSIGLQDNGDSYLLPLWRHTFPYVIAISSICIPYNGESYPHPYDVIPSYVIAIYSICILDNGE